jgi:hypothetical protein
MLFALAVSFGVSGQANADTIEVPVTLTGDVIKVVSTTTGATVDASGNVLDASGNIVGVVVGPDGKAVHEVTGDKIVVIKQRGDSILSASLYNRIYDLQNTLVQEKALGHISSDKYDALYEDIKKARADLDAKIASGSILTFDESLATAADLDSLASRVKGELTGVTATSIVFNPMVVVESPDKKRISIYQRTVKTSDGVTKTTQTTTTETTR